MASLRSTGGYILGPSLAEGGMGAVYLGRLYGAGGFDRLVAVKQMAARLAGDPQSASMFLDEARTAARVHHVNVVQTLDVLRSHDGTMSIVMEYVAGLSLDRVLLAGRPPAPVALAILTDALAGLDAAHRATDLDGEPLGLVHRDLSPQNLLVGVDGFCRVADFGIAKAKRRLSATQVGHAAKGKTAYNAPEVLRGEPATVRSDVWSLGVTLWEALVGAPLFDGENDGVVLYAVLETVPAKPSARVPALGTSFDDVFDRAVSHDPNKRFESAQAMAEALEACGPKASTREVAAYLEHVGGSELTNRRALVEAFERQGREGVAVSIGIPFVAQSVAVASAPAPVELALPLPTTISAARARRILASPLAVVGLLAVGVLFGRRGSRQGNTSPPVVASATSNALQPMPVETAAAKNLLPSANLDQVETAAAVPQAISTTSASHTEGRPRRSLRSVASAERSREPSTLPEPRATPEMVSARAGAEAATPSCEPPFRLGPDGEKHYKVECFRDRGGRSWAPR